MAQIRYHIQVTSLTTATVTQDVLKVGNAKDTVIFTGDSGGFLPAGREIAVRYPVGHCPFTGPNDPKPGKAFIIRGRTVEHDVKKGNKQSLGNSKKKFVPGFGDRWTFPFECGHADNVPNPDPSFVGWGSAAGDTPSGGDDGVDP
jgi:hypothetical protein